MEYKVSHDSETPAHGQQVITACAFIHHDFDGARKVFLPKRAETKKFLPSVYELPGGHINYGEDIVAGLKREIMEEMGMKIRVGDPFAAFTYLNEIKGSHSVEIIYFAEFEDPLEKITIHPEDHSSFDWIAENELAKVASVNKRGEDPEFLAIKKGFTLLRGESAQFS
jgi:8-oxo-dGTP pyrophosphatase MutT (NUDIX family)